MMATIMSLYFLVPTLGAVNGAMGEIAAAFPEAGAAVAYVFTIVALAQIPSSLISGAIAGKKVRYQTICIISTILYVIAGCSPYFFGEALGFAGLLVSRFIFGLAVGFFAPLTNALVAQLFDDENRRASAMGFGNAMFSVGGIVSQLLGGFLCLISWQTTFLVYAIGVITLILVALFLKEPVAPESQLDSAEGKKEEKAKLPGVAFFYLVMFAVALTVLSPLQSYCAVVMQDVGLGDSATAGLILSGLTVACAICSVLFGTLYRGLKQWILPLAVLVVAISLVICYIASTPGATNLPLWVIGFLVYGFGMMALSVATPQLLSVAVPLSAITFAMGLNNIFMNIGNFLGTPYSQLVIAITGSSDMRTIFSISAVLLVVIALIMFIAVARIRRRKG